jgi:hypothetical protein
VCPYLFEIVSAPLEHVSLSVYAMHTHRNGWQSRDAPVPERPFGAGYS